MESDDDRPPVPRLQSSKHPSLPVNNFSKSRENEAGLLNSDDDDSASSADDSYQMSQSSGTSGGRTAPKDSSQEQDYSKEWMFAGYVSFPNRFEVDRDDNGPVPNEIRQEFSLLGESLKESFCRHAPAKIEYIVIVGDIETVSTEVRRIQKPYPYGPMIRGYVATTKRVNRKAWEDSIRMCDADETPLTWTKVTGGIRCWSQFDYDRDNVNDPNSTVGVLAMWGTRSYFYARGCAWMFHGSLALPPRTAEDSDILQMAREAFNAAAGLPNTRPSGIKFFAVHCDISELVTAPETALEGTVSVRGFLQAGASTSHKWESWLPDPWQWCPLRGGLCGNEEFESASIEVKTESSKWLEIIVDGKLGRNNTGRLADAKQARAAHSAICSSDSHRARALTRISIVVTGPRRKRLIVLDIQTLLGQDQQCGRKRRHHQAPPNRTGGLGFSCLCKYCIGAAAAAAAPRRGNFSFPPTLFIAPSSFPPSPLVL